MKSGLTITFKGTEALDHVTDKVERRYDRLRRRHPEVLHCHVVLAKPHKSKRSGNEYTVSVEISVPGRQMASRSKTREPSGDLFTGIAEAFSSIEHRLSTLRGKRDLDRRSAAPAPSVFGNPFSENALGFS